MCLGINILSQHVFICIVVVVIVVSFVVKNVCDSTRLFVKKVGVAGDGSVTELPACVWGKCKRCHFVRLQERRKMTPLLHHEKRSIRNEWSNTRRKDLTCIVITTKDQRHSSLFNFFSFSSLFVFIIVLIVVFYNHFCLFVLLLTLFYCDILCRHSLITHFYGRCKWWVF